MSSLFFESLGLAVKEERGGRIFPVSDHSSDVIKVLEQRMKALDVKIHLKSRVEKVLTENSLEGEEKIRGVLLENGAEILADRVIIATGGCSYQATGSTGDGYTFARETNHKVTELRSCSGSDRDKGRICKRHAGAGFKKVRFTVKDGRKCCMMILENCFYPLGISGPLVLTASSRIGKKLEKKELQAFLDLKAALSEEQLDGRLLREFENGKNKQFKNVITGMFPAKLYPVMLSLGGIPPEKKVNEITKEERREFIQVIKHFPLTLTSLREFREAIITQGGVSVKDIQPKKHGVEKR